MRRIIIVLSLTFTLIMGMSAAASATHNGYKYNAPTLTSLQVVSCTEVRVTWKTTGRYTGINYSRSTGGSFEEALNWDPWERGTKDEVRWSTTAVVGHLRPERKYYFRVSADNYEGHRLSKYSNVKSIVLPAC